MHHIIWIVMTLIAIGTIGCQQSDSQETSLSIEEVVHTTSAPISSLTNDLAEGLVPVELLCPESQDPARWRPDVDTIGRFQRARLIVANGAQHERWITTAPLPRSRVVHSAQALPPPLLTYSQKTHSHGPDGKHTHQIVLGTTWIDPLNAQSQAQVVHDALTGSFPEHAAEFSDRFSSLTLELEHSHERIEEISRPAVNMVAPMNPYGYLAQRFGWKALDLSSDPDEWLKDPYMLNLIADPSGDLPTIILTNSMPSAETSELLIKDYSIHAILWETGSMVTDRSYLEVLSSNIARLEDAVESLME